MNILTGSREELAPWLAGHMDVNAIDVTGADGEAELERPPPRTSSASCVASRPPEPVGDRGFLELKTVWHPIGR